MHALSVSPCVRLVTPCVVIPLSGNPTCVFHSKSLGNMCLSLGKPPLPSLSLKLSTLRAGTSEIHVYHCYVAGMCLVSPTMSRQLVSILPVGICYPVHSVLV